MRSKFFIVSYFFVTQKYTIFRTLLKQHITTLHPPQCWSRTGFALLNTCNHGANKDNYSPLVNFINYCGVPKVSYLKVERPEKWTLATWIESVSPIHLLP